MTVFVRAYPYAIIEGTIDVPDGTENIDAYVEEHFDEIDFGEPDLDYAGTDFEADAL